MISVVITTYQRRHIVGRSVESALKFVRDFETADIIIVDDCSTDGTEEMIRETYAADIKASIISYVMLETNVGVTGAKNAGALRAKNDWVTFLDSDDTLIQKSRDNVVAELSSLDARAGFVFFPVISEDGKLTEINFAQLSQVDVHSLVEGAVGEYLPVVRKDVFLRHPYDEDLRGFEGLSYIKIAKELGPQLVSKTPLRVYYTSGNDRLSSANLLLGRRCRLAIGWLRVLKVTMFTVRPIALLKVVIRILANTGLCVFHKLRSVGLALSPSAKTNHYNQ